MARDDFPNTGGARVLGSSRPFQFMAQVLPRAGASFLRLEAEFLDLAGYATSVGDGFGEEKDHERGEFSADEEEEGEEWETTNVMAPAGAEEED